MTDKSPLEKLQDAVTDVVRTAKDDPAAAAGKAAEQVRGVLALGFMVVGQVAQTVADRLLQAPEPRPPSAPKPPIVEREQPTPADVARVVELKPPAKQAPAKKAPAKKAPVKKAGSATPSGKLPVKKAPAKKAPAKKTPAKKAPAKKSPAAGTET
jgi:hypothetical protein